MYRSLMLAMLSLTLLPTVVHAQKGDYRTVLSSVESNGKIVADSIVIKVDSVTNPNNFKYSFSDALININWYRGVSEFYFELKNLSSQSIKLNWDDAAFIETDGTTKKIFHNGVKYIDRNNSQPPSTIISGAKILDIIAPTDNAYFSSGSYGGWRQLPLLPKPKKHMLPEYDSKRLKIFLPVSANGTVSEYIFTFTVRWIEEVKNK